MVKGAKYQQPGRIGKVYIGGHFDPSVKQTIRRIQARFPHKTIQDLIEEAIHDLFDKYDIENDEQDAIGN